MKRRTSAPITGRYECYFGKDTTCLCPKCGRTHGMWMNWRGRGVPRKHCASCRGIISKFDRAVESGSYEVVT